MSWEKYKHVVWIRSTDYSDYGGSVKRWEIPTQGYPDCSCGCKWFRAVDDSGWGVCINPNSPRAGLLTWDHQAGDQCFEPL